ncbi:alpha/beta hydrolase [Microbacterium gorillae]|uniref:alpha/beta hydrolase n=1 Tax=Microbacterium gorillae TaxID=1231063 RepID=UPI00058DE5C1|nr:alpha/beta hydrolase [Microbacterium gorillae]
MPLDPFFAERLRVHRRYLLGQAWDGAREKATAAWHRVRPGHRSVAASVPNPVTPTPKKARGPHDTARAKHRRAALRWDAKELETVGAVGPEVSISEHVVPVPGYPDVRLRVYRPLTSIEQTLPVVLAFFGGAFRIGGIDYPTTDAAYRRRTADAGVVTIAVDYALAPEHRFPTQIEQGYAALCWVRDHADALEVRADRIAVQGTSAGGCIAAAVTLMNRDRGGAPLALQVLEVPVVELTGRTVDFRATWALGIPMFIAVKELLSVAKTYLGDRSRATDLYASPLLASSHAGLPPAVILTAEYDPLRGNGDAYGAALRKAGIDASVVRYQGVNHDVAIFLGALPAARRWHADVVSALRRLHA